MAITPQDLGLEHATKSIERMHYRQAKLQTAQQMIAKGNGSAFESEERRLLATLRQNATSRNEASGEEQFLETANELGAEALIGQRNNILSAEFLEIGSLAARPVCRISRGVETGTGFLVGNGIVVTNYHVIKDAAEAGGSLFEFLFDKNTIGTPLNTEEYVADTNRFFWADETLDICFVSLLEDEGFMPLKSFGWLPMLKEEGKALIGDSVNIIQHPRGQMKQVVVHDSTFMFVENDTDADAFCWYSGDTDKGSSGAPVFNNRWEVLAVHHEAIPATDKNGFVLDVNGKKIAADRVDDPNTRIRWIANEGIRVSRIVEKLKLEAFPDAQRLVRDDLLTLWSRPRAARTALQASFQGTQN